MSTLAMKPGFVAAFECRLGSSTRRPTAANSRAAGSHSVMTSRLALLPCMHRTRGAPAQPKSSASTGPRCVASCTAATCVASMRMKWV